MSLDEPTAEPVEVPAADAQQGTPLEAREGGAVPSMPGGLTLGAILARVRDAGSDKPAKVRAASAPDVLQFAAALPPGELAALKAELQNVGVPVTDWGSAVKSARQARRREEGKPDFRVIEGGGEEVRAEWLGSFRRGENGSPIAGPFNAALIVRNWPPFASLRLNGLTLEAEMGGRAVTDVDEVAWRERIEKTFSLILTPEQMKGAIATVAKEREYHPVRDYLDALQWDGTARLGNAAETYLGAEDDGEESEDEDTPGPAIGKVELCNIMLRRYLIAAVARAYMPGCKQDNTLLLYSPTGGKRKTSFFEVLFGETWSGGGRIDPHDKDTVLRSHQLWCQILDEVDGLLRGHDGPAIKGWQTERHDIIRPPYASRPQRMPRGFVFGATTNEQELFSDPAGSRRWWTIRVGDEEPHARNARLARDRDQLWAEAVVRFRAYTGPDDLVNRWWLTDEEEEAREAHARAHRKVDEWEADVQRYVEQERACCRPVMVKHVIMHSGIGPKDDSARAKQADDKKIQDRVARILRTLGYVRKREIVDLAGARRRTQVWVKPNAPDIEREAIQAEARAPA